MAVTWTNPSFEKKLPEACLINSRRFAFAEVRIRIECVRQFWTVDRLLDRCLSSKRLGKSRKFLCFRFSQSRMRESFLSLENRTRVFAFFVGTSLLMREFCLFWWRFRLTGTACRRRTGGWGRRLWISVLSVWAPTVELAVLRQRSLIGECLFADFLSLSIFLAHIEQHYSSISKTVCDVWSQLSGESSSSDDSFGLQSRPFRPPLTCCCRSFIRILVSVSISS